MFHKIILFIAISICTIANSREYKAVDELNLDKYIGKWYQVYQDKFNKLFQGNARCSTAEYSMKDATTVSVLNQ